MQFAHTNLGHALELDGLVNTRPVAEPTEVPNIDTFDDIVYKKVQLGYRADDCKKNSVPCACMPCHDRDVSELFDVPCRAFTLRAVSFS